jgi:hypothetical protein
MADGFSFPLSKLLGVNRDAAKMRRYDPALDSAATEPFPSTGQDIALPVERDIELPADPRADIVNWPSPATHGPGLPMPDAAAQVPVVRPSAMNPSEAVKTLRSTFRGFDPRDPRFDAGDDAPIYGDPNGALATKAMRDIRAGELAGRLPAEEAATFVPTEGYVQGEPGRRTRSNASAVMSAFLTRRRLDDLSAEAAADPFTGQAEQDRVGSIQNALTEAETLRRPEATDAANAVASRNAFANFLMKQKGYEADISAPGRAALDAASRRKIAEAKTGPLVKVADPDHPGQTMWVSREAAIGEAGAMPASEAVRVNSAKTVLDTRDDILRQLADPGVMRELGPLMGRINTLQDFIGNPPPQLAGLAGQIESFAFSNMGVHGMRSARGAQEMKQLFNQRHTPESLAEAVKGISQFSDHFIANATGNASSAARGNTPSDSGGAASGTVQMRAPNGSVQPVPAAQVEHYRKLGATVVQ